MADPTAPIGFLLDASGDLAFDDSTGMSTTSGLTAVIQAIGSALQLFQGEWFLDLEAGVPYFQSILGEAYDQQALLGIFRRQILKVPNVLEVVDLTSSFDAADRSLTIDFEAITVFGDVEETLTIGATPDPVVFPPPTIDAMTPAQVASIIGQAEPTDYWTYDGTNLVTGGADLDQSTSFPSEFTSATLGGQIYRYVNNGATNIRDDLSSPGTGDVGAETVTCMVILGDPAIVANRGVFGNRENSGGLNGYSLEGNGTNSLLFQTDSAAEARSVAATVGTSAEVVLFTRSIAGDLLGIWTAAGSDTKDGGLLDSLTNSRPVQVGANANDTSAAFDCGGVILWVGTAGDFGDASDFAAARLAFAQALGYE